MNSMSFSRLVISLTIPIFALLVIVLAVWNFLPFAGDVLLFTAYTDDHYTLFTLDVERELLHQATRFDGNIYDPAWSADGERIAYVYERDIYVADASGRNARNLTNTEQNITNAQPVWSPEGHGLVFLSDRDGNFDAFLMDVATGQVQNLTATNDVVNNVSWSPDGTMLLYVGIAGSERNVYLYHFADGSVTQPPILNESANYHLAWSADGDNIAFMERENVRFNLHVWDMVSDETVEIATTRTNAMMQWSPDGERIVFVDSTGVNVTGIFMMDINSGEITPLFGADQSANIDEPTWSPDGERIVFRSNHEARIGLYTISARGGTPERITPDNLSLVSVPLWRP